MRLKQRVEESKGREKEIDWDEMTRKMRHDMTIEKEQEQEQERRRKKRKREEQKERAKGRDREDKEKEEKRKSKEKEYEDLRQQVNDAARPRYYSGCHGNNEKTKGDQNSSEKNGKRKGNSDQKEI